MVTVETLGILATAIGVAIGVWQLVLSRRIASGEFLLRLDDMFRHHQDVHIALRPGGKWYGMEELSLSAAESAAIDAYMGLFERIYVLVDKGIIDAETVKRLYGYRIKNIVANRTIRQIRLVDEKDDWKDFIALCNVLGITLEGE